MAKTIEQLIAEANIRLKAGRTGLKIEMRYTNKLSLRGQLPPKPTSTKTSFYSQWLPLKYLGNPAGIAKAEADAFVIAGQLIKEKFSWHDWIETYSADTAAISEILGKLKTKYLAKNSQTSWQNYWDIAYIAVAIAIRIQMPRYVPLPPAMNQIC